MSYHASGSVPVRIVREVRDPVTCSPRVCPPLFCLSHKQKSPHTYTREIASSNHGLLGFHGLTAVPCLGVGVVVGSTDEKPTFWRSRAHGAEVPLLARKRGSQGIAGAPFFCGRSLIQTANYFASRGSCIHVGSCRLCVVVGPGSDFAPAPRWRSPRAAQSPVQEIGGRAPGLCELLHTPLPQASVRCGALTKGGAPTPCRSQSHSRHLQKRWSERTMAGAPSHGSAIAWGARQRQS
jgi:hypothetical protein